MDPWVDEELGNAAAHIISGKVNPSGRLPVTFPRDIRDCPAYASFPGEQEETYYSEGLFVGHRWWDFIGTKPQYPIGFGLSYNQFVVRASAISSDILTADAPVTQICGFAKSSPLSTGEEQVLEVIIDAYSLGMYDTKKQSWVVDAGSKFDILLGTDAESVTFAWHITVPKEIKWVHKLSEHSIYEGH
ncbi:thermostable beta-glucosidase B [Colletotrichum liriopes]|uniref:beta-glucosidase n=1 Tax=Colletotrichum liriopes TaxID=708192 RepID=A0AA37H204_9PEZI|nr:thermostable beta-glucosidase B [Colletotrichum liriopes]